MSKELRWRQRFENFDKAFKQLTFAINLFDSLNNLEKQGLIHRFEYTFDLAWKVMKDYLEYQGYEIKGPRDAIKTSFQIGLISNGHSWLDALEERNMTVHSYDEKFAENLITHIKLIYYPEIENLYLKLKEE